jgi:hypothetical protein
VNESCRKGGGRGREGGRREKEEKVGEGGRRERSVKRREGERTGGTRRGRWVEGAKAKRQKVEEVEEGGRRANEEVRREGRRKEERGGAEG